ncbi:MAG: PPC domain-containing DNA-binding protein [Bacillota bacterium]
MFPVSVNRGRTLIGRLAKGEDLLDALNRICQEENIRLGKIQAIGALIKASVGYYHQDTQKYSQLTFNEHLELISLQGNISVKDNQPFVHAHVALMKQDGQMFGGHLMPGCQVFACEYIINEFLPEEAEFIRQYDPETGLFLWAE